MDRAVRVTSIVGDFDGVITSEKTHAAWLALYPSDTMSLAGYNCVTIAGWVCVG